MNTNTRQILLCVFGTVLEWYDFSLFAALTPIIAEIFFSSAVPFTALLLTFATFSSGFLMRPIGAIFFGHLGDRIGRKSTLLITITIMTISTTGIGLIPTDLELSVIILIIFRIAQGFAASGEYPGGITLLAEQLNSNKKGFIASIGIFAAPAGIFMGSSVCAIISQLIDHTNMLLWGWRVPFIIALPLGLFTYSIRSSLLESEEYNLAKKDNILLKTPLLSLIKEYREEFARLLSLYIFSSVTFYINFIYFSSYSSEKIGTIYNLNRNVIITLVYAIAILFFGFLSDTLPRRTLMIGACVLMICFIYPLFFYISHGDIRVQILCQSLISIMIGMFAGPLALVSANSFPVQIRYTGIGVSLNLATALFGGTAPIICIWLVKFTNNFIAPIYYLITVTVIALITLLSCSQNTKKYVI